MKKEKLCGCGCGLPTLVSKWKDSRSGHAKGAFRDFIRGHSSRVRDGLLEERFWRLVNKKGSYPTHLPSNIGRCWVWTRKPGTHGYGTIKIVNKHKKAHRVAWFLTYGKWPEKDCLHKCDNRVCCRPSHLWEGTDLDNVRDMVKKGRHRNGASYTKN